MKWRNPAVVLEKPWTIAIDYLIMTFVINAVHAMEFKVLGLNRFGIMVAGRTFRMIGR